MTLTCATSVEFRQGIAAYAYCMIAELVGGKKVKIENTDYTTSGCTKDILKKEQENMLLNVC